MRNRLAAITFGFTLMMGVTSAIAVPLYQGLRNPTQTPKEQGWTYLGTRQQPAPTAQASTSGTVLDSGSPQNYAGYFIQSPLNLDRSGNGFAISFRVQINSETHNSNNRAGFSMIVVPNRLASEANSFPYAIELGFWTNSIWAQSAQFTRAESVSLDTTSAARDFVLYVQGNQYKLFTKGSSTPILQGQLRQYTGFTPPPLFPNPYATPNLVFMGDDTTSATAKVTIGGVYASLAKQLR